MTVSTYVTGLRAQVGHDLLLLPAVTAVIRDRERYLLARHEGAAVHGSEGNGVQVRR